MYICSDDDSDELELMKQDVIAGKVQLLFFTPEALIVGGS